MTSPSTADPKRSDGPSAQARKDAAQLLRLLTPREAQVLARLAAGEDLGMIAENLGIAPGTARTYLHRAMRKLGAGSRDEAVAVAARLTPPVPVPPADARSAPEGQSAPAEDDTAPEGQSAPAEAPDPRQRTDTAADAPPAASPGRPQAPEATSAPRTDEAAHSPAVASPDPAPTKPPATFAELCAAAHTRLVQQTFLLTGRRHLAVHCVHLALGVASRRWRTVSALPDPEGWVRARAFEAAMSSWRRGSPRRSRLLHLPHRRIKVRPATGSETPGRLTRRDRALLKALRRISRPRRQALVLHDTLGLPAAAVAVEVESSTAAAEGRVRAARAVLAREVPELVGDDPDEPGFGERLGELLHRAAVHGCPSPRRPVPVRLRTASRLRAAVAPGAAALLTLAMGAAMATTLLGNGPSSLFRPDGPAAVVACTAADTGSAGPALPGADPGVRTPWCSPLPGTPAWYGTPAVTSATPSAPADSPGTPSAPDAQATQPTDQPTTQPSALPTDQPTTQPSALPTELLTTQPSALPTAQPTAPEPTPLSAQPSATDQPTDSGQPQALASAPAQAGNEAPAQPQPQLSAQLDPRPASMIRWWVDGPGAAGAPASVSGALLPVVVPCSTLRPCPSPEPVPRLSDRLR